MPLIDFFASPQYQHNSDMLYKARLLAGILLAYLAIMFGFIVFLAGFSGLPWLAILASVCMLLVLSLSFLALLHILRTRGQFYLCAQITVFSAFLGVVSGVVISGGPIDTPAGMIIVMPAILAFCLMGLRPGLIWTTVILVMNLAGIALQLSGVQFMNVSPPEMETTNRVFNWIVAFFCIISIVIVYEQMNARLKAERDAERDRYKHMATHDPLTGLANRKLFNDTLALSMNRASRNNYSITLVMIDLNGFKPINDTLGHEAGDIVLQHVARQLQANIRSTDLAARLGGDEFAIIFEGVKLMDDLDRMLEKLQSAIASIVEGLDRPVNVTGSMGVAMSPRHTREQLELIRFADHAMYYAKQNRIGVKIYEPDINDFMAGASSAKDNSRDDDIEGGVLSPSQT